MSDMTNSNKTATAVDFFVKSKCCLMLSDTGHETSAHNYFVKYNFIIQYFNIFDTTVLLVLVMLLRGQLRLLLLVLLNKDLLLIK